jgi:uncharacterized protein (TIGR02452 family)
MTTLPIPIALLGARIDTSNVAPTNARFFHRNENPMSIHSNAQEILDIVERGGYTAPSGNWVDVRAAQATAMERTELFRPDALTALFDEPPGTGGFPMVEVVDATTQDAAQSLVAQGPGVALLNFASARNPGGGFLNGARAQEEEVCRCSGLYSALLRQRGYYDANRFEKSALYTDHIIYSPNVPFFRTSAKQPWLEEPFLASVITAPAPNAGAIKQNKSGETPQIRPTFERRWRNVLLVAASRGHRVVVLGAWGCGAFQNDPEIAANTVLPWLRSPRFAGCFDKVVFAIPDGGRSGANLVGFRKVLAGA